MATFDDIYFYGHIIDKNMGLKVCPFNSNHKVKESKYQKHVQKCEQLYPTRNSIKSNLDSIKTIVDDFGSQLSLQTKDDISITDKNIGINDDISVGLDPNHTSSVTGSDDCLQSEPLNGVEESMDPIVPQVEHNDNDGIESDIKSTDNCLSSDSNNEDLPRVENEDKESEEVVESIVADQKQISERLAINVKVSESAEVSQDNSHVNSEGSGDENWNSGKHFTLFPENSKPEDELSDNQIMEMAESFVDIAIISRMNKSQKKRFNDKLIEFQKLKNERRLQAFNDLIMFRDECYPELQSIPNEIRKPRLDVRQVFKLRKLKENSILAKEKTNQEKEKTTEDNAKPSPTPVTTIENVVCNEKCFHVFCGGCKDSIDLNESNFKRLAIFCSTCSGIKFGGYFECKPCKLYGYFAKNQIEEHMSKHYPERDSKTDGIQTSPSVPDNSLIQTESLFA